MSKVVPTLVATLMAASGLMFAAPANAEYDEGCEAINWGFLGRDTRSICDGPRRPDGSWDRSRFFFSGGYTMPARTTCSGTYSVTCYSYEKTYVELKEIGREYYVVTDATIPPGEPGWLPQGAQVGNAY
jgi:hypothetical protein